MYSYVRRQYAQESEREEEREREISKISKPAAAYIDVTVKPAVVWRLNQVDDAVLFLCRARC